MTDQPKAKADKRPHFVTQARPLAVPPELLALPDDATISEEHKIGRQNGSSSGFSVRDYREMIEATIARQAEDFFTVNEAAQILADARPGHPNGIEWVKQMRAAHRAGMLAIREPYSRIPVRPSHSPTNAIIPHSWTAETVDGGRDFMDLVRGTDVDAWLQATAGYGFPVATGAATQVPEAVQRHRSQEAAILATLADLGFEATRLPPTPPGKKSPAKRAASNALIHYSEAVFNKAWQRLRDDGKIDDREP